MLILLKKLLCGVFHDAWWDEKNEFHCLDCDLHIRRNVTTWEPPIKMPERPDFETLFSHEEVK